MPKRSSQSRAPGSRRRAGRAAGSRAERDVVQGGEVREQQLVLEHQPDPAPVADAAGAEPGRLSPSVRAALGRRRARRRRASSVRLAGAVGADHGHDLAGLGGERGVDAVGDPRSDHVPSVPGHALTASRNQRSRSSDEHPTETSSSTRLRARAASWSVCSAT